ncbi:hypothetical protein HYG86_09235 [Alkalicella caledoniensis]|uniref:Resolvase HTH domain-containing protein n=1 Tax=Alkalicella caledoniensis TaxID=2731377 RepID=A0A7G9W8D2_ALKCA|nr:helix-turn-helix domain-containing protein [Alkalicella caledoniensis]QNO14944.1 hypothetical protein HYG86_09235 [Alkalicella caledoniensis]
MSKNQIEWNEVKIDALKNLYIKGHTIKAIAKIYKVSEDAIREQIVKLKLKGEI